MIKPTLEQTNLVTKLLYESINTLIVNDSDIFNIDIIMPQQISEDARILNRELHETAINHRLAYYLEQNMQDGPLSEYSVDIEYNRFYGNAKLVKTVEGLIAIRPDIVIHTRMNRNINPQHFLAIEAKKGEILLHDINKIKGLISDSHYNYLFGFTISYCSNNNYTIGSIYYFDGREIISQPLNNSK